MINKIQTKYHTAFDIFSEFRYNFKKRGDAMNTVIVGERGQITIPKEIRKKYGIKKKQPLIIEDKNGEIVIKPAVAVPIRELEKFARKFDDDFIKEIIEEDLLKEGEEEKILSK